MYTILCTLFYFIYVDDIDNIFYIIFGYLYNFYLFVDVVLYGRRGI